jgi:hypothetical protein
VTRIKALFRARGIPALGQMVYSPAQRPQWLENLAHRSLPRLSSSARAFAEPEETNLPLHMNTKKTRGVAAGETITNISDDGRIIYGTGTCGGVSSYYRMQLRPRPAEGWSRGPAHRFTVARDDCRSGIDRRARAFGSQHRWAASGLCDWQCRWACAPDRGARNPAPLDGALPKASGQRLPLWVQDRLELRVDVGRGSESQALYVDFTESHRRAVAEKRPMMLSRPLAESCSARGL